MRVKTKNMILAVAVSVIAIFIPSLLFAKWIEGIVFFFCHWLIREQFPKQYHHIVPSMCRLITSVTFFFGVSFILPISWSLFSAVPINYFIGWVGFTKKQADYYELQCAKLIDKYCNEKTTLLEKCREARLSERDTEIAIMYFYEKKQPRDIFLSICLNSKYKPLEWDSLYVLINRIGKKLEKIV